MTYDELRAFFGGTQVGIAEALGITQSTVSSWNGVVPDKYQYQAEVISGGVLRADEALRLPRGQREPEPVPQQAA